MIGLSTYLGMLNLSDDMRVIFFGTDSSSGILVDHHFVKLFVFICGDMNGVTP